ncbi:MAG: NAD(+)--dinitrogen-reductase ADP-D-ribosyltransferase [Pseudomonadota bacterium]
MSTTWANSAPSVPATDGKSWCASTTSLSFTGDRTHAGQFGAPILEIEVPVVKLLFFNDPLPRHPCAEKPSIWKAYGIRNPVHLDRGWPMIRKTSQRRERFRP